MDDNFEKELFDGLSHEEWKDKIITNLSNESLETNPPSPKIRELIVKLTNQGWNSREIAIGLGMSKAEVELIIEISKDLSKGDFMEKNKKFNGVWGNKEFKVKIKGDTYVSYYNNSRYGKGKIIFENEKFILTSTHARWLFFWLSFVEVVEGKCINSNDTLTVSDIEGRYSNYNGTWVRVKK